MSSASPSDSGESTISSPTSLMSSESTPNSETTNGDSTLVDVISTFEYKTHH